MAFTLADPETHTQFRNAEIEKRKFNPSYTQVMRREPDVFPSYRYEFNSLDDAIKVQRSVTGEAGTRSVIGQDRSSKDLHFFMAEIDRPWVEEWFQANRPAGASPQPISGFRPRAREASIMMGDLLRDMDNYFWAGDAALGVTGIVDQDATPDALTTPLSTVTGREEFVDTLVALLDEAEGKLAQGERVLAIDSQKLPYMIYPFAYDATGGLGPSLLDMTMKTVDRVVAVQNPAMDGKAVLHYAGLDNAAYADTTSAGVQVVLGEANDNQVMRIFKHGGLLDYRGGDAEGTFNTITGL